ncbi:hypothetical protein GQ464_008635 [Rhodocaloribacter litoris]|uniref:hypothetical protein n=1 Tax=Rhodocaloribacter litoris TaxID=2558931 RepID=UPI00141F13BC|nr:hypothetical protein GQ464_008635 [Rhodocaloribacter litoris]
MKLLQDEEWCRWSDREIARRCRVSHSTVIRLRSSLEHCSSDTTRRLYQDKHGNVSVMETRRIGGGSAAGEVAGEAIELLRATPVADDPAQK